MVQAIRSEMRGVDTVLLGRRTYEQFVAYWPHQDPESDPFAGFLNDTPKLVVSTTLRSLEWRGSTLIGGDVTQEIADLKRKPGGNVVILGSITLVESLLRAGLLDELEVMLIPILLGSGRRLFEGPDQVPLKLTRSRTFDNGVLSLRYERADQTR